MHQSKNYCGMNIIKKIMWKRKKNKSVKKKTDPTKSISSHCSVLFLQCCKIRRIARFSKLHFTSKQQELLGQYLQHPRTVKIGFCSLLGSTVNIVLQGQGYDLLCRKFVQPRYFIGITQPIMRLFLTVNVWNDNIRLNCILCSCLNCPNS